MSRQTMSLHDLYLIADTAFDLDNAEAVVARLCANASTGDLRILIDEGWIETRDPAFTGPDDDTPEGVHADLRERAAHVLIRHLQLLADSFRSPDVVRFRFDSAADHPRVDAYMTGGLTPGDGPTESYDIWTFLFATDQLPPGWSERIGAAGGLVHPAGTGAPVSEVTFRAWADRPESQPQELDTRADAASSDQRRSAGSIDRPSTDDLPSGDGSRGQPGRS